MKEIQSPYLLRTILRATVLTFWTIFWAIPVFLMWLLRSQSIRRWLVHIHFKGVCSILGLKIKVEGEVSKSRPLLLVANHASYVDVFVIGSKTPVSFTPKREVRSWPAIGFLCVLADCVFVERKPSQMQEAREEMQERLDMGKVLCIFPEGTTNDGKHVKSFKSGFFSLAEEHHLPVQPVTITYTHLNDQLLPDDKRDHVAWVGEATFFGHFLRLLGYQSIGVTIHYHAPKLLEDFEDRKALSGACQIIIQEQQARALANAR